MRPVGFAWTDESDSYGKPPHGLLISSPIAFPISVVKWSEDELTGGVRYEPSRLDPSSLTQRPTKVYPYTPAIPTRNVFNNMCFDLLGSSFEEDHLRNVFVGSKVYETFAAAPRCGKHGTSASDGSFLGIILRK